MLDAPVRRVIAPGLDAAAAGLDRLGVRPLAVTGLGWLVGIAACVAVATSHWSTALALWLANRALDGLDGPLARRRGATDLGGFLDLLADFSVYGGFVLAVGVAVPEARLACLVLLLTYYVSGTAFLTLAPLLERRGARGDGRSVLFVGGLAEGTETVLAYAVLCLLPAHAETVLWVFAAMVALTALQRIRLGVRSLGIRAPRPLRTTSETLPEETP